MMIVQEIDVNQAEGAAWVMDDVLPVSVLTSVDNFRLSLPLDSKRPTVDRRFFADGHAGNFFPGDAALVAADNDAASTELKIEDDRPIASILEQVVNKALLQAIADTNLTASTTQRKLQVCHVLRYMRFLEYSRAGTGLEPHTDGDKICDDTGHISTHTLLLYLSDCSQGGETVLLRQCKGSQPSSQNVIYSTVPQRGRLLLFPHRTPHVGASTVSVPKICLRAEACIIFETAIAS